MVKNVPIVRKNHNPIDVLFGANISTPNIRRTIARPVTHKRVTWKDESVAGLGGSVEDPSPPKPELSDPAILAVRENPKYRYGRDELLKLREVPLSQRKPDFVDTNEISPTIWDPTKWNFDRKKSDTPIENGTRPGELPEHRRRPGDPRERIRKENDGIVLSPQRRSFNSGCFVPVREPPPSRPNNRPHSPPGGPTAPLGPLEHIAASSKFGNGGPQTSSSRRIGSGRILRDWDYGDKPELGVSNDQSDYGTNFGRNCQRGPFGRDFEPSKEPVGNVGSKRGGRYNDRRRERDEEPEWFSSGPLSQNDTIELRGFDDCDKLGPNGKKKMSPSQAKRARDWYKRKSEISIGGGVVEEKNEDHGEGDGESVDIKSPPDPPASAGNNESGRTGKKGDSDAANAKETSGHSSHKQSDDDNSLFEDILKSDTILNLPGFLANGGGADGDNNGGGGGKSRFSQWFSGAEPYEGMRRRPSIESEAQIKNLLSDIFEPSVTIPPPGDADSYFAPISPAANTGNNGPNAASKSDVANMMEMLHKSNKQNEIKSQMSGRFVNLVDLEAKMRQAEPQMPKHRHHKSDDDMAAFNRLLEQVTGGHAVAATAPMTSPKAPPMTLMEMLSHSQQQDEARMAAAQHLLGPASPAAAGSGTHHHGDYGNAARIQQQLQNQKQTEMLSKFVNAKLHAYQHDPGMQQQSRELLNRPEAQAILQALHQRIPSPRELQVHTQNILQRALIRKKLEEQQENYRKKQEMQQRGQSPNNINNGNGNNGNLGNAVANCHPAKSVSSPTPLAFTPTSVLRKMTAEKDEGGSKDVGNKLEKGRAVTGMKQSSVVGQQTQQQPQQQSQQQAIGQWNFGMSVKQPGRPIVKANNFQQAQQQQQQQQPRPQEQFFNQQQEKLLSQLQQVQQHHQQQQQQQRNKYHGGHGYPNQQFQQLRAQHQQHARPSNATTQQQQPAQQPPQPQTQQQMNFANQTGTVAWQQFLNQNQGRSQLGRGGLTDGDLSPTSNQLTRWFSPDLLERARGGELPSTAGLAQHALSLEEIERLTVHN